MKQVSFESVLKMEYDTPTHVSLHPMKGQFCESIAAILRNTTRFRVNKKDGGTELSRYVWKLREQGKDAEVRWEVLKRCQPYRSGEKVCDVRNTGAHGAWMFQPEERVKQQVPPRQKT